MTAGGRTPEQVVAAMAAAARLTPYDADETWADVLFAADPDGATAPSPAGAPDRELLAAVAAEYAALDAHLAILPERTRRTWLEDVLGIGRLPALPDRVVAHATVDPKAAPAVLPPGTPLRGGKDAFGNERRYVTLDALTAHGAALTGVRSFAPGDPGRAHGVAAAAPDFPLRPSAGPEATHSLRIHSPALAFDGGDLTAQVAFTGAAGTDGLSVLVWRWSRADGTTSGTTGGTVSGSTVTVTLTGGCGALDGETPWIEGVVATGAPVPVGFSFTGATVRVTNRTAYVPEAAFYNDGAVDVTKEFQPFGAVAKRGDAFYVRSDEAFGKALATVEVAVSVMQEGGAPLSSSAGGTGIPVWLADTLKTQLMSIKTTLGSQYAAVETQWTSIYGAVSTTTTPSVVWQRREDGAWKPVGTASSSFGTLSATVSGSVVASETFAVAGQPGHYLRAFLVQGDFGWTDYQTKVADFATRAVAGTTPKPTMPPVPVPPIASAVTVRYTTNPVEATLVESSSGWRRQSRAGGAAGRFTPFRLVVSDLGATGMVAIGLELPDAALGSSVSLYLDVDSASPCGSSDTVAASWQFWDGTTWSPLAVADGSRQLREAGLLRFVAPRTWAVGCVDVSADTGRWVRIETDQPGRLGVLLAVVVDAVVAEFVSRAADPGLDPSSAQAVPVGTIKGTLAPVIGVKKVTNLASVRGRAPETDAAYLARASARVRHRDRALTPWDLEQHVALALPEVAAVLCLPHTGSDGLRAPGHVGLVVVPDRPLDVAPRPSVSLAGRVVDLVQPRAPIGATLHVLCPDYRPVTVVASIRLRPGVAALTGTQAISAALERVLHPTGTVPVRWGRDLYASTLIAFLERQPDVDVVLDFALHDGSGGTVEVVTVDPCRGLYCSSGDHRLSCEEQL
ncbi:baseplate J/gp47 family protein [Terrabacter sp. LjRoot27]|uniref:baseplate J/gp47 family protein n=1 Tax=Terrabacter sp. LjRoot27 TaxID=3342306 RepID=UPI003ED11C52